MHFHKLSGNIIKNEDEHLHPIFFAYMNEDENKNKNKLLRILSIST